MAAYSLTQFVSVLLLYSIDSNLADIQFLYIDLFLITTFAFFFGLAEAYEGDLDPHPPMKSLISLTPITSLILQLAIVIGFQACMNKFIRILLISTLQCFSYNVKTGREWQKCQNN